MVREFGRAGRAVGEYFRLESEVFKSDGDSVLEKLEWRKRLAFSQLAEAMNRLERRTGERYV
jgi:hypothetical protein